ncbi:hypothetical protein JTB14_015303 [Gonioctena quinquepunctata]|nr:hypothetical protein JTB14_015303 [Gonioctena quinquepunctata]
MKEISNLGPCDNSDSGYYRFAGQTMTSSSLILVTFHQREKSVVTVNCENMVFGSVLLNELLSNLSQ